jgi:hypothetical protein
MRQCEACDAFITRITKDGYEQWFCHDGHWLCRQCYDYYVWHPYRNPIDNKKYRSTMIEHNKKRIRFHNHYIYFKDNPRKGVCKLCGKKKGDKFINSKGKPAITATDIHHFQYHEEDPLKDTIELCDSCHLKEGVRLGQIPHI